MITIRPIATPEEALAQAVDPEHALHTHHYIAFDRHQRPLASLRVSLTAESVQLLQLQSVPHPHHEETTESAIGLITFALLQARTEGASLVTTHPLYTQAHLSPNQEPIGTLPDPALLQPHYVQATNKGSFHIQDHQAWLPHIQEPAPYDQLIILNHGETYSAATHHHVLKGALEVLNPHTSYQSHSRRLRFESDHTWSGTQAVAVGSTYLAEHSNENTQPHQPKPTNHWCLDLYNDYVLAHILCTLHDLDFFKTVGDPQLTHDVAQLSKDLNIRPLILNGMLNYLEGAQLISRQNNQIQATPALSDALPEIHFLQYMVKGYGNVLAKTTQLAKGQITYWKDIKRDDVGVANFQPAVKETVGANIRKVLQSVSYKKMAHLGCGRAQRLIHFCKQDPNLHAVGVDFDPAVCHAARRAIDEAGLSDRITMRCLDVMAWAKDPDLDVDMILFPGGMMHDIVHRQEADDMLQGLHQKLRAGTHFLIQDMNATCTQEPNFPLSIAQGFFFVHDLMGVAIESREAYVKRFEGSGWQILHTYDAGLPNTWIYLLRNNEG